MDAWYLDVNYERTACKQLYKALKGTSKKAIDMGDVMRSYKPIVDELAILAREVKIFIEKRYTSIPGKVEMLWYGRGNFRTFKAYRNRLDHLKKQIQDVFMKYRLELLKGSRRPGKELVNLMANPKTHIVSWLTATSGQRTTDENPQRSVLKDRHAIVLARESWEDAMEDMKMFGEYASGLLATVRWRIVTHLSVPLKKDGFVSKTNGRFDHTYIEGVSYLANNDFFTPVVVYTNNSGQTNIKKNMVRYKKSDGARDMDSFLISGVVKVESLVSYCSGSSILWVDSKKARSSKNYQKQQKVFALLQSAGIMVIRYHEERDGEKLEDDPISWAAEFIEQCWAMYRHCNCLVVFYLDDDEPQYKKDILYFIKSLRQYKIKGKKRIDNKFILYSYDKDPSLSELQKNLEISNDDVKGVQIITEDIKSAINGRVRSTGLQNDPVIFSAIIGSGIRKLCDKREHPFLVFVQDDVELFRTDICTLKKEDQTWEPFKLAADMSNLRSKIKVICFSRQKEPFFSCSVPIEKTLQELGEPICEGKINVRVLMRNTKTHVLRMSNDAKLNITYHFKDA